MTSKGLLSFPTRRSSDLDHVRKELLEATRGREPDGPGRAHEHREGRRAEARVNLRQLPEEDSVPGHRVVRSEEHTSELQSQFHLVCRLLLEKKKDVIEVV